MKLITRRNSIIALLCLISFSFGGFITQKAEEEKITILLVKQAQKIKSKTGKSSYKTLSLTKSLAISYPSYTNFELQSMILEFIRY